MGVDTPEDLKRVSRLFEVTMMQGVQENG
jgi:hypothetical protein